MGQQAFGILYGAVVDIDAYNEEAYEELYDRLRGIGASLVYCEADGAPAATADVTLCGFWLAVGASGKDGVPDLVTVDLTKIPAAYSESYGKAVAAWPKLKATGLVDLPTPGFWLAETNVA